MFVSIEFLGLFSEFVGEHFSRFISEKGKLAASMLADAGSSIREYTELLRHMEFVPVDLYNDLTETSWDYVQQSFGMARDYCFRLFK